MKSVAGFSEIQDWHLDAMIRLAFALDEAEEVQQILDEPESELTQQDEEFAKRIFTIAQAKIAREEKAERHRASAARRKHTIARIMEAAACLILIFAIAKHNGFVLLTNLPESYGDSIDLTGNLSGFYRTGEKNDIIVCGAEMENGPFRLMMVMNEREMLAGLQWTRWVLWLLVVIAASAVVTMMFSLKRYILKPLDKTMKAIEDYGQGRNTTLTAQKNDASEFQEIYQSFNAMTDQIEHLRIANYEETIRKQKAELRFYQTQIRPHFILNCLTTINNLALSGATDKLTDFTQAFSGFARSMFRTNFAPVSVADELKQVDYYITMQAIRQQDQVFCACQADEAAKAATLPAMLIQTLVENCVKHGADASGNVSIFVNCTLQGKLLSITVEDGGEGFSEAALQAVNHAATSGFGLKNVCATLELLYGNATKLTAQNVPGAGSRVIVTIPQA